MRRPLRRCRTRRAAGGWGRLPLGTAGRPRRGSGAQLGVGVLARRSGLPFRRGAGMSVVERCAMGEAEPAIQLSWVLPLYRTAEQLAELLERIGQVSRRLAVESEVILVDDACPEGCGALAELAAARDARITVVRLPSNGGQDAALRAGLRRSRGQ